MYEFFSILDSGSDGIRLNATTYVLALRAWIRFSPDHNAPDYVGGPRANSYCNL